MRLYKEKKAWYDIVPNLLFFNGADKRILTFDLPLRRGTLCTAELYLQVYKLYIKF